MHSISQNSFFPSLFPHTVHPFSFFPFYFRLLYLSLLLILLSAPTTTNDLFCSFLFSLSFFLSLVACVAYPFFSLNTSLVFPLAHLTPFILAVSFLSSTIRIRLHLVVVRSWCKGITGCGGFQGQAWRFDGKSSLLCEVFSVKTLRLPHPSFLTGTETKRPMRPEDA